MAPGSTLVGGIRRRDAAARARQVATVALALVGTAAAAEVRPAGPEAQRRPIRVALAARVEAKRPEVTLGDVAEVSGADRAAVARLAGLRLGALPGDGSPIRLERSVLERWIRARTGIAGAAIGWEGAPASDVRLSFTEVSGEVLAEQAAAAVREAAARQGVRPEITIGRVPRAVRIPAGALTMRARRLGAEALRARRVAVWIDLSVDGRFARAVPVSLDVSSFGPAYVATRRLAAGQVLDGAVLAVRDVDWTGRDVLPARETAPDGFRLLRPMAEGDVLTRTHAEPVPLVKRGARATLRQSRGRIELESAVEVLEDGRRGQPVRVRAAISSAPIVARVIGPDRVEVGP